MGIKTTNFKITMQSKAILSDFIIKIWGRARMITSILRQIEEKRNEMVFLGMTLGMQHKNTLVCSEELDLLINRYYKLMGYY